jgi:hypothetical protein
MALSASEIFKLQFPQSVGVFSSYEEAQKVVDFLADKRFPVQNLCIVGTDIKSVERVLGRRNWGTVILQGLQQGLMTGLLVALIMMVFMPSENVWLLVGYALAIGVGIGILLSVLSYWMSQGKRDFTSASRMIATKYEVLCEHKFVPQAKELIQQIPGIRLVAFNAPAEPPAKIQVPTPVRPTSTPSAPQADERVEGPPPAVAEQPPNPYAYPVNPDEK